MSKNYDPKHVRIDGQLDLGLELDEKDRANMKAKQKDIAYKEEFEYKTRNIYNEKLDEFSDFVLKDNEPEALKNKWSSEVFENSNPIYVEVGTGYGHFMQEFCENNSEINFCGIDYRFKRSFELARRLSKLPHQNFRYIRAKGERIEFMFAEREVDKVFLFFPDPWPKKRHNKNRIFQEPFLNACFKILKPGGELQVKTDHQGYFEWMKEVAQQYRLDYPERFELSLESSKLRQEYPEHFLSQYKTKFEKLFTAKGFDVNAIVLKKASDEY